MTARGAAHERHTMTQIPLGIYVSVGLIALIVIAIAIDRALLWMERRGWIYYRTLEPRIKDGARGVLGMFQEIVQPDVRHVKEDREQRRARADEANTSDR